MKKRLLSLLLTLVMLLGLLPTGALAAWDETPETPLGEEALAVPVEGGASGAEKTLVAPAAAPAPAELAEAPDLAQWLSEGDRSLTVCGVTVTADNAGEILADTDYSDCGHAEFSFYAQGDAVRPTLMLRDLNVDDTSLDYVVEYVGSGLNSSDTGRFQEDILYIRLDSDCTLHARANDIEVRNASLDLSGLIGDEKLTLEDSWPSELDVKNGDLHIHDCALDASGLDVGIEVTNGALTVSGEDTVVSFHCGGHDNNALIIGLNSTYPLTLEDILRLEDVALVAPRGTKATLLENQLESDGGQTMYQYTVKLVDENNECVYGDIVIKQPHAHAVDGADVTFDHTLASGAQEVTDPDTQTATTIRYLMLDGEPWVNSDATSQDDLTKNDLPAGSYYLTDNILFDQGLEVNAGTVNLCLNGKKLEAGGDVSASGAKLTLSDCSAGKTGSIENKSTACFVGYRWENGQSILGELIVDSGAIKNTMTKAEGNGRNDNTAIYNGGYLTLQGGTVSGPYGVRLQYSFKDGAGGTEKYTKSPIILKGAPKLDCSIADVHLILDTYDVDRITYPMIDATGYTGTEPITIAVENNSDDAPLSDKLGTPIVKLGDTPAGKFTLLSEGYFLEKKTVNGETCLVLAVKPAHFHPVCGVECAHQGADAHEAMGFDKALTAEMVNGDAFADSYTLGEGNYYLAGDIETEKEIKVSGNVNLCFNGHTITYNGGSDKKAFITVASGAALNTCDCQSGGGVKDTRSVTGGREMRVLKVEGEAALYGGAFNSTGALGGVDVTYSGKLTVDGADVTSKGDAVYLWQMGQMTLRRGTLKSTSNDAVVIHSTGFTMEGGTVTTDSYYSGVRFAEFGSGGGANAGAGGGIISGGTIKGGFGIRVDGDQTVTLSGAPVIDARTDIYFLTSASGLLQVGNDLAGQFSVGYYSSITENNPYTFTAPADADYSGHFTSYDKTLSIRDVVDEATGKHTVQLYKAHAHAMSADCSTSEGDQVTFTAWDGSDMSGDNGQYGVYLDPGSYYLTDDVTINSPLKINSGVVDLCLNGHTLNISGIIQVYGTLNICDCSQAHSGRINHTGNTNAVVADASGSKVSLYGGTVEGKYGLYANSTGAEVAVYGGTVKGSEYALRTNHEDAVITLYGAPTLEGGTADIFLYYGALHIGDTLAQPSAAYTVKPQSYISPAQFTSGWKDHMSQVTGLSKYIVSASDSYGVTVDESTGELKWSEVSTQPDHTHSWATAWSSDANGHWHACAAAGCAITDYANCGETGAAYGAHVYDNDQDATCNTCGYTRTVTPPTPPDQGDVTGEVEVKGDTPAVTVDEDSLKDLAGKVSDGDSVTVKLTVEKQDAPNHKEELESIISGKKDDVLYLDLSLVKQVNDAAPEAITDTGDKVLEIAVPYDLTGKTGVSVYRKHGDAPAQALAKADTKADGTYRLEGTGTQGKVYIYASKFSTYAIGYTAVENLVSTQAPALYLGSATPIPCDGSTVDLSGGGTAVFQALGENLGGGKVYGLTLENASITDIVRIQLGREGGELVYGAGALFLGDRKDILVVTLKGENTIAVTGTDIDDRIAALAAPAGPVMLTGDGSWNITATAAQGKMGYGVSAQDLHIYAPLTAEGSTNAVFLSGSVSLANTLTVEPAGTRPVAQTLGEGEYVRTFTTLQADGQSVTRAVFARRETPLAPLYLDGTAIQADGQSVSVGGGTATLTREGTDYVLTLSGVRVTKTVKMNGSYAGLFFLGDTTQGLFPSAALTIHLADDAVIDVSDDEAKMGLDLGGFPMSGFDAVCTGLVAAGGRFNVTIEGPGSLSVKAAATGEGFQASGVNVTGLTLKTAADITALDGAVYVAGDLTLGSGYAVTQPKRYTLSPSGYGKALMDGDAPAGRVTVEKKATPSGGSTVGGYVPPVTIYSPKDKAGLPFTDVAVTDAFYDAVKYVYENKLMLGTSDTTFEPQGELTRAMLATILYRSAGSPKVEGAPEFEDTLADTWYSDAIVWASQTQVLRGYGNGQFGPEDAVSKEMMNMVTARQAGEDPEWVGDPALALPATRAEIAQLLYKK